MQSKKTYEKPQLRKVRLEVKTSVLSVCHSSTITQQRIDAQLGCLVMKCHTP